MLDIYTKKEIETVSSEHILLNVLGGTLESKNLIDKKTNDKFGQDIDAAISNFFHPIRTILNLHNGDQKPPAVFRKVICKDDENTYNIKPGGELELSAPSIRKLNIKENHIDIDITAKNEEEVLKIITNKIRKTKLDINIDNLNLNFHKKLTPNPFVSFNTSFEERHRRCIAKMVCNFFAMHNRELFLEESFDTIRIYILQGDIQNNSVMPIKNSIDTKIEYRGFSHIDNILGYTKINHKIIGFCILYGSIQFTVNIGHTTTSIEDKTIRFCPFSFQKREDEDLEILKNISNFYTKKEKIYMKMNRESKYKQDVKLFKKHFENLLSFMTGASISLHIKVTTDQIIRKVFEENKHEKFITNQIINNLADKIAENYVEILSQNGHFRHQ